MTFNCGLFLINRLSNNWAQLANLLYLIILSVISRTPVKSENDSERFLLQSKLGRILKKIPFWVLHVDQTCLQVTWLHKYKCSSVSRNNEIHCKCQVCYKIYQPSAIKLLISVSGQRQSKPEWIETWKMLRLMFFKFSHLCFQNALEQISSWSFKELSWFLFSYHSRIIWQLIEGLISSFLTKDIKNPMIYTSNLSHPTTTVLLIINGIADWYCWVFF